MKDTGVEIPTPPDLACLFQLLFSMPAIVRTSEARSATRTRDNSCIAKDAFPKPKLSRNIHNARGVKRSHDARGLKCLVIEGKRRLQLVHDPKISHRSCKRQKILSEVAGSFLVGALSQVWLLCSVTILQSGHKLRPDCLLEITILLLMNARWHEERTLYCRKT